MYYQFSHPKPLLQDVQLLHAEHHAPCQLNFAYTKTNLQRLQRNNRAMFRQICSIKPEDVATVSQASYLQRLSLMTLSYLILRERKIRWFVNVEHSSGAVRTACDTQEAMDAKRCHERLTENDCRVYTLTTVDPE